MGGGVATRMDTSYLGSFFLTRAVHRKSDEIIAT